ncbi:hypothetical protein PVK06_001652 [Gossypium arboreum]|uniref:Uncharacterized protein n=1 Tax=Gossypium arboreum TaxID=29729 RepID=A0ABR0R1U9_GOSAR|nr:hypothetical protein PVK06_001652 [Gossypium arboreum]
MRLGSITHSVEGKRVRESEKKQVQCFFYSGPYRMQDYLERSRLSTTSKKFETKLDSEVSKLGSMILNPVKAKKDYCICILNIQQQYLILVGRDKKGRTKVLLTIQLVEGVHGGKHIDLIDQRSATKIPLEMIERQKTGMKPVEPLVGLPPMREVNCASNFGRKIVMQTG